jgi:LuxR family transcriptional regulator, maltose regulon positive regulatory protein
MCAAPAGWEFIETGRAALAEGQWDDARAAFLQAAAVERSPEALEGLGWAFFWLEENEEAFDAREEAYRLYLRGGDPRRAARIAINLGIDYYDFRGRAVCQGWLQRARRLLDSLEEGPEHGWLFLWDGHFARMDDHDLPRAKELAARAVEIGQRHGDTDLELLARALEGLLLVTEGDVGDGMQRLDEATAAALAGEMSDVDSVAQTCCLLVHACERVRDYDRASQWAERMQRFARRWSTGSVLALCSVQHAAMLIGVGQWEEAEEELKRAGEALRAKRPMLLDEQQLYVAELRRRQGRWEEAEAIYQKLTGWTTAFLGRAWIALDRGDAAAALDLLDSFHRKPLAEKWVERVGALQLQVEALVKLEKIEEARESLGNLHQVARRVGTPTVMALGHLASGIVRAAENDSGGARGDLEEAIRLFDRACAPWEEARARLLLAACFASCGSEALAAEEARQAAETFERLGASRYAAGARQLQSRLSGKRSGDTVRMLTPRELQVLRLVARGMSDKEAAQELGLSEHTVHRHVANILNKLQVPSRTAAVAQAARDLD